MKVTGIRLLIGNSLLAWLGSQALAAKEEERPLIRQRILRQDTYGASTNATSATGSFKGKGSYGTAHNSTSGKGSSSKGKGSNEMSSSSRRSSSKGSSKGKGSYGTGKGSKGEQCELSQGFICSSIQYFDVSGGTCDEVVANYVCPTQEEVCNGDVDVADFCSTCDANGQVSFSTCSDFLDTCCLLECCQDTCLTEQEVCVFLELVSDWTDPTTCTKYNFQPDFCPCSTDHRTTYEYCKDVVGRHSTCFDECQDFVDTCCSARPAPLTPAPTQVPDTQAPTRRPIFSTEMPTTRPIDGQTNAPTPDIVTSAPTPGTPEPTVAPSNQPSESQLPTTESNPPSSSPSAPSDLPSMAPIESFAPTFPEYLETCVDHQSAPLGSSGTIPGRINVGLFRSECTFTRAYPGTAFASEERYFEEIGPFANQNTDEACVLVDVDLRTCVDALRNPLVQVVAFTQFNPLDIGSNYLADVGNPFTYLSFGFVLPGRTEFVLVGQQLSEGDTTNDGFGCQFSVKVSFGETCAPTSAPTPLLTETQPTTQRSSQPSITRSSSPSSSPTDSQAPSGSPSKSGAPTTSSSPSVSPSVSSAPSLPPTVPSLLVRIEDNDNLQTFRTSLLSTSVASLLEGSGPDAIFAPLDQGFETFELTAKLQNSTSWRTHLRNLVLYHVFFDELFPDDLVVGTPMTLTTGNGEDIVVTKDSMNRTSVNGQAVVEDINAVNGYLYIVGSVLRPVWVDRTLLDLATSSFSTLSNLVALAALETSLTDPDADLTLFAPTNDAFAALDPATIDFLENPAGRPFLQEILLYHLVPDGPIASEGFVTGPLTTLQGSTILLETGNSTTSTTTTVNNATVTAVDLLANNGVIHAIDAVLLPEPLPTSP